MFGRQGSAVVVCADCQTTLQLKPCKSAAGWYAGYYCNRCGPYGRVSGYYRTEAEVQVMVDQRVSQETF